jgi:hypothetical protein
MVGKKSNYLNLTLLRFGEVSKKVSKNHIRKRSKKASKIVRFINGKKISNY